MNFTREDILKILNALLQLSRKDSEFKEANTPLSSNDYIAILLDGINKKVSINNLLSTLGLLKKDDFINVSDRYDEYYIQLSEAITIIANNKRKKGLVITFQDIEGNWKIYQFTDEISNFIKTEYWKDLFDFKYPIVNSILPDEEDLTLTLPNIEGNSFIQLKDKEYDPQNFSGMATKILRKNIIEVNGVKKNILTQEDFDLENCIYEIRYDFTLTGNVTIPANCVLEFDGGSVSGEHIITGLNTGINAGLVKIFNTDITLTGTWNVAEAYPEWFGAKGDGTTDDRLAIQTTINYFNSIKLQDKVYHLEKGESDDYILSIPENRKIEGSHYVHKTDHFGTLSCDDTTVDCIIRLDGSGLELSNFSVITVLSATRIAAESKVKNLKSVIKTNGNISKSIFQNVKTQFGEIGFNIQGYLLTFSQCYSFNNLVGFYVHGIYNSEGALIGENTTIRMDNCYAIISQWHGYIFKDLDYSSFNNLAADGCGHYFEVVNSWDDVRAPYYCESIKSCCFTTPGAESSLKMMKIQSSVGVTVINPFIYYDFHTAEQKGGTYTPGHVFEYVSCTDLRVFGVNLHPVGDVESLVNNNPNAPLYYISDTIQRPDGWLSVTAYNVGDDWKNYDIGGTMGWKSIKLNDRTYKNEYSFSSGSIADIMFNKEIDIENNTNNYIKINLTHSETIDFSISAIRTLDLCGKTVEINNGGSEKTISAWNQAGYLIVKNGTLIIKGFIITDSQHTSRSCFFKAINARIILDTCRVFEMDNTAYIIDCDDASEAEFINYDFTTDVTKPAPIGKYKASLTAIPSLSTNRIMIDNTILDYSHRYIVHGTGQAPKLELINKYVDTLPSAPDSTHGGTDIITGLIAFYDNKYKWFNGTTWVDATSTAV